MFARATNRYSCPVPRAPKATIRLRSNAKIQQPLCPGSNHKFNGSTPDRRFLRRIALRMASRPRCQPPECHRNGGPWRWAVKCDSDYHAALGWLRGPGEARRAPRRGLARRAGGILLRLYRQRRRFGLRRPARPSPPPNGSELGSSFSEAFTDSVCWPVYSNIWPASSQAIAKRVRPADWPFEMVKSRRVMLA